MHPQSDVAIDNLVTKLEQFTTNFTDRASDVGAGSVTSHPYNPITEANAILAEAQDALVEAYQPVIETQSANLVNALKESEYYDIDWSTDNDNAIDIYDVINTKIRDDDSLRAIRINITANQGSQGGQPYGGNFIRLFSETDQTLGPEGIFILIRNVNGTIGNAVPDFAISFGVPSMPGVVNGNFKMVSSSSLPDSPGVTLLSSPEQSEIFTVVAGPELNYTNGPAIVFQTSGGLAQSDSKTFGASTISEVSSSQGTVKIDHHDGSRSYIGKAMANGLPVIHGADLSDAELAASSLIVSGTPTGGENSVLIEDGVVDTAAVDSSTLYENITNLTIDPDSVEQRNSYRQVSVTPEGREFTVSIDFLQIDGRTSKDGLQISIDSVPSSPDDIPNLAIQYAPNQYLVDSDLTTIPFEIRKILYVSMEHTDDPFANTLVPLPEIKVTKLKGLMVVRSDAVVDRGDIVVAFGFVLTRNTDTGFVSPLFPSNATSSYLSELTAIGGAGTTQFLAQLSQSGGQSPSDVGPITAMPFLLGQEQFGHGVSNSQSNLQLITAYNPANDLFSILYWNIELNSVLSDVRNVAIGPVADVRHIASSSYNSGEGGNRYVNDTRVIGRVFYSLKVGSDHLVRYSDRTTNAYVGPQYHDLADDALHSAPGELAGFTSNSEIVLRDSDNGLGVVGFNADKAFLFFPEVIYEATLPNIKDVASVTYDGHIYVLVMERASVSPADTKIHVYQVADTSVYVNTLANPIAGNVPVQSMVLLQTVTLPSEFYRFSTFHSTNSTGRKSVSVSSIDFPADGRGFDAPFTKTRVLRVNGNFNEYNWILKVPKV